MCNSNVNLSLYELCFINEKFKVIRNVSKCWFKKWEIVLEQRSMSPPFQASYDGEESACLVCGDMEKAINAHKLI